MSALNIDVVELRIALTAVADDEQLEEMVVLARRRGIIHRGRRSVKSQTVMIGGCD